MASTVSTYGTNILTDIVGWSEDLPSWQRDALRRIVENGSIESQDIDELTSLCRHANGLPEDEVPELKPLRREHIPAGSVSGKTIAIRSISNPENVNALDCRQTLTFAESGLTVVFGYNGSGKSGYGRILRRSCRARSKGPPILPNVTKPAPKSPASAELQYVIDGNEQPPEQWIDGQRSVDVLGAVSFFDSECAAVHVREPNNIAFTPFGLDVLPVLGNACKSVQKELEAERKRLEAMQPAFSVVRTAQGQLVLAHFFVP